MRKTKDELIQLQEEKGVDRHWSFSRVDCFKRSPYEYFLKYVLKKKEDREDCIYASTGTLCHDILDRYYENKIPFNTMANEFNDGWSVNRDIAQLKFDRNDPDKDRNIGEKYYLNLHHFFMNHIPMASSDGKVAIEPFVSIDVNGNLFIGYIDAVFKDKDGCFNIIDFKTSSIFKGASLESHSGQLILYALALHQKGIPLDKIKGCFNFLKYVTIEYPLKKGDIKTKDVERSKIGEGLQSNAKMWLKEFGYDPDEYLKGMLDTNGIDCLPEEVREKYKIKDCYVYVDVSEESIAKWVEDLSTNIKDILLREKDYEENGSDKAFWDSDESVEKESYYFATLCGYSANLHLPYKTYLERLEASKNGDMFAMPVGSNMREKEHRANDKSNSDIDLSWL